MINVFKEPKILFINKVYISNSSQQKKIEDNEEKEQENYNKYEKLPPFFKNYSSWVKSCDLHCWYCTLPFNSTPIFIPTIIEPVILKKNDEYNITTYGVFCCFNDAYNFIYKSLDINYSDKIEYIHKLNYLYKLFYGKNFKGVVNYINPLMLEKYGGKLTEEEYNNEKLSYMSEEEKKNYIV